MSESKHQFVMGEGSILLVDGKEIPLESLTIVHYYEDYQIDGVPQRGYVSTKVIVNET